jgi:hypothetical protein
MSPDLSSSSPLWKAIIRWGEAQYSDGPWYELQAACAAVDSAVMRLLQEQVEPVAA